MPSTACSISSGSSISSTQSTARQLKGWLRVKKIALIVQHNPTWRALSEDWGKPTKPFDETKLRAPETF